MDDYSLVLVKWRDCWHSGGWQDLSGDNSLIETESVGWLYSYDEESVIIHSSKNTEGGTGDVFNIPTGTVKEMIILQESKESFLIVTKIDIDKVHTLDLGGNCSSAHSAEDTAMGSVMKMIKKGENNVV